MELMQEALTERDSTGVLRGIIITRPVWQGIDTETKKRFMKMMSVSAAKLFGDANAAPFLYIAGEDQPPEFTDYPVKNPELRLLLGIISKLKPRIHDFFLILPGVSPFLDAALTEDLMNHHRKYLADYTYSENIPPGFTGDLITSEMAELLSVSALREDEKATIRDYITSHMNDYDTEIFFRLPDLRQYRLDFTLNTARSSALAANFAELPLNYELLSQLIHKNPYLIRPAVSYLEIELTNFSKVSPVYMPGLRNGSPTADYLNDTHLKIIYSWIRECALENDLTVCLGGTGDSFYHPSLNDILRHLLSQSKITRVYLETFGIDLDDETCERIARIPYAEKLHIIIRLNSLKAERWESLHNSDLFRKVRENLEYLKKADLPFTVHAEILRMQDNADELNDAAEYFKNSRVNLIISKYNRYIDKLPERRLSDLTPLHRDFCWHLSRDIYITSSGKIPVCRQDPFAEGEDVSDLLQDGLSSAFLKLENYHSHSVRGDHHSIPMDCLKCDEWYTFNG